jgi:hypothetical protein
MTVVLLYSCCPKPTPRGLYNWRCLFRASLAPHFVFRCMEGCSFDGTMADCGCSLEGRGSATLGSLPIKVTCFRSAYRAGKLWRIKMPEAYQDQPKSLDDHVHAAGDVQQHAAWAANGSSVTHAPDLVVASNPQAFAALHRCSIVRTSRKSRKTSLWQICVIHGCLNTAVRSRELCSM